MELKLKGKVVIITGASSGLGLATARMFAAEGANIALTYHKRKEEGETAAKEIATDYCVPAAAFQCDISSSDSVEEVFNSILSTYGKVDILVNNAGIWPQALITDMKIDEWKKCIDINLTGHFLFSRIFAKYSMATQKKNKIVNIASFSGFMGSTTGHAHYAASKAGLINLTKTMARELGPYGINVNAVSPGMMYTNMTKEVLSQKEEHYTERIPLRRIADPAEIAGSIVFLASQHADYITGATLDISGGLLMH